MDKYKIRNNRAFVLLTKYLLVIIRQLNEKNILMNIEKSNLGYDDILIEEASKEILDLSPTKKKQKTSNLTKKKLAKFMNDIKNLNQKRKKEEEKKKKEVRKVELIYFCLLKFKGLIRYMHFQGLSHNDIKKISNYIQHTHFKKGQYIFRQHDKSDKLYGVIKGKVIIRAIKVIDMFRKFSNESLSSNVINEEYIEPLNNIPIELFMSDCEIISSDEEEEEEEEKSENSDSDDIIDKEKHKKKLKNKKEKQEEKKQEQEQNDKKLIFPLSPPETNREKERKRHLTAKQNINKKIYKIEDNIEEEEELDEKIEEKIKKEKKEKIIKGIIIDYHVTKKKREELKEKEFIKSITNHQTPEGKLEGIKLDNFIKEFEYENFIITNGMCFGEWGLVYSIPRTTSIYCLEDCHLFYLDKEPFNRILAQKFLKSDINKLHFLLKTFPLFKNDLKDGKLLRKVTPLFFENETIVYTPFDKADYLYVVYQGECALVNLNKFNYTKEDFFTHKNNLKVISKLTQGGIAGYESCFNIECNYKNALLITKEFTTLIRININLISEKYKDFKKSIIPLYEEQKKIYDKIRGRGEKIKNIFNLNKLIEDNKFSINNVVKNAMIPPKKTKFQNDFKSKSIIINNNLINEENNNYIDNKSTNLKISFNNKKLRAKLEKNYSFHNKRLSAKKLSSNKFLPDLNINNINNTKNHRLQKSISPKSITKTSSFGNTGKKTVSFLDNSISSATQFYNSRNRNSELYYSKRQFLTKKLINYKNSKFSSESSIRKNAVHYEIKNILPVVKKNKILFYNSGKYNLPFLSDGN